MTKETHEELSSIDKWERTLVDDYHNYRWQQVMEPLCDKLQSWKAGEVSHEEMDQFLEHVHQQIWEMRNIFGQRRDRLVSLIQWWDREWFLQWVRRYSPPPGVRVLPETPPADEGGPAS